MDFNELKELIGEDYAITVYDYFADWTIDNLVQRVLGTYTEGELFRLAKQLKEY